MTVNNTYNIIIRSYFTNIIVLQVEYLFISRHKLFVYT